ncbi:hypothetical protein BBJ28_00017343 [Nothophytophthora sp. Chile5]|nr:hypothetical protein BBJ28_00017343 [Nothophytophthora sp. Chile5]
MRNDWNFQNKKGESALHVAVAEDQLEIVKHLVANGAMLNLQEKKNKFTPLMLCLAQQPPRFEELFPALLKGKPDLSVQDSSGQTILHLAAQYEELESLELLLKAKAKVDAVDSKKMTALHVAVGKGNLEIVQLLVDRGHANVNAADGKGNTPLYPLKNAFGNTPLHSEAMHCDPDAAWPTAAAEALTNAFPDLLTDANKNGLTAQQTFEQAIDAEEPVEDKPPAKSSKKSGRRGKARTNEDVLDNTAAARAAAIAHSKKKSSKGSQEGGTSMAPYMWVALIFAVLAMLNALLSSSS